jgi:hypothetical protein
LEPFRRGVPPVILVKSAEEEERKRDKGGMKNERVGKWLKRKRGTREGEKTDIETGKLRPCDDDN